MNDEELRDLTERIWEVLPPNAKEDMRRLTAIIKDIYKDTEMPSEYSILLEIVEGNE